MRSLKGRICIFLGVALRGSDSPEIHHFLDGGSMAKSNQVVKDVGFHPKTSDIAQHFTTVLHASAIGIDVHAQLLVCAYQCSDGIDPVTKQPRLIEETHEFGTSRSELDEFAHWCHDLAPDVILMESTGVFWISPYEALEDVGFTSRQLRLVNARDVKAVLGRKTDKIDAMRLAQIARLGQIKASFVPTRDFREMRLVARRYHKYAQQHASAKNSFHKLLSAVGLRASSVFSDVGGKAATAILKAYITGAEDYECLVIEKSERLKASAEQVYDALNFEISAAMRQQLRMEWEAVEYLKARADECMKRLAQLQAMYQKEIALLMTIPGIKETSARLILAELCADLKAHFQNSEKFCSWIGICPGNNISANKSYSSRTAKGNKWLRRVLTECANGIGLSHLCLRDNFEAFKLRRGRLRAVVATAHLLCRIIYSVLVNQRRFQRDLNGVERQVRVLTQRAEAGVKALSRLVPIRTCGNSVIDTRTGEVMVDLPPSCQL